VLRELRPTPRGLRPLPQNSAPAAALAAVIENWIDEPHRDAPIDIPSPSDRRPSLCAPLLPVPPPTAPPRQSIGRTPGRVSGLAVTWSLDAEPTAP